MARGTDAGVPGREAVPRGHARPGDILIYIGPGWAHEGAYWLTMAIGGLFGLGGLVGATVEGVQAHPAKALPNLALVAGGLAWVFVWRGITRLQARTAETRVAFLEEWLRRQLTAR